MIRLLTIFLFAFLLFDSCVTPAKFLDWAQQHPGESARICSDLYPVRSEYRPGKDSVRYEAVQLTVPGGMVGLYLPINPVPDSMHRQAKQGNMNAEAVFTGTGWQVKCRTDSLQLVLDSMREIHLRVDTQLQENTAHVRALQGDSSRLVHQVGKALTRGDTWRKWALYAFAALVLLLGWTYRKQIIGLIKKLVT
jgi:hypothetical protein